VLLPVPHRHLTTSPCCLDGRGLAIYPPCSFGEPDPSRGRHGVGLTSAAARATTATSAPHVAECLVAGSHSIDTAKVRNYSARHTQVGGAGRPGGLTLIQLANAFVVRHPAMTSVIIGRKTMEHLESQLAAADVKLPDDVLDRIDEIVLPGTTINPADGGWVSPALGPAARRR
jgi:hypothetical protein